MRESWKVRHETKASAMNGQYEYAIYKQSNGYSISSNLIGSVVTGYQLIF